MWMLVVQAGSPMPLQNQINAELRDIKSHAVQASARPQSPPAYTTCLLPPFIRTDFKQSSSVVLATAMYTYHALHTSRTTWAAPRVCGPEGPGLVP